MASIAEPDGPPKLPFVLSVGITGHRADALRDVDHEELAARLQTVLQDLIASAQALRAAEVDRFDAAPMQLRFVTPLADGADQIGAQIALGLGFELAAILPFDRDTYRADLPDDPARTAFDRLLGGSACILELPNGRDHALDAYVITGRAIIAHSDIMIAVWDGLPPRGRGGTGEVVQLAVVNGTPVVHVPPDPNQPIRLMWSAFDPTIVTRGVSEAATRPFGGEALDRVMSAWVQPPPSPDERRFLDSFQRERARRLRARIEYPLMLAFAGVKRISRRDFRERDCIAEIDLEWSDYCTACGGPQPFEPAPGILARTYSWSDRLATYYAQTYRSGHIFNFILGAMAVCIGLAANILGRGLLEFAIAEGLLTAAIIANTRVGVRNEWHRRWLNYRQLAERLRPMRSLKLLGIAAPDPPGTAAEPVPRRWIDWYAAGVWRAAGCPSGSLTNARVAELAHAIADHEVAPQVAYHQGHARQIDLLDSRLERIAAALFWVTLLGSVFVIIGLATHPEVVNRYGDWLTLIGAGFPALGTAIFGIRFQGDFGGSAVRSLATAGALDAIAGQMRQGQDLGRIADLTEQAARTMLRDLEEWRLVNQQQELDLI